MQPLRTFRVVATRPDGTDVVLYSSTTLEIAVRLRRLLERDSAYCDVRVESESQRPDEPPGM